MYEFYPDHQPYQPDPRHHAPFAITASAEELQKWGIELDHSEERDRRETMSADRVVPAPEDQSKDFALDPTQAVHKVYNLLNR